MSPLRILVMHNGDWVCGENGYEYNGDKLKGIIVDEKITYIELLDRVCNIVKVDPAEFLVTMKCLYKAHIPTPPTEILDNDDVDFFIGENLVEDHSRRTPLCITINSRESINQGKEMHCPAPFDSGSVSNQTSGLAPTVQHSQFSSLVPFTDIEEQNTTALNCVPQAGLNCADEMQNIDQCGDCNDDGGLDNEAGIEQMQTDDGGCSNQVHHDPSNNMSLDVQNDNRSIQGYVTPEPLNCQLLQQPCLYAEQLSIYGSDNLTVEQLMSNDEIEVGQLFPCKKDVQSKLSLLAIKGKFEFKVKRSTKDLLFVVCTDKSCKWRLRASKMVDSDRFLIRKFCRVHTCMTGSLQRNHPQASSWVVGQLIKAKYAEGTSDYRPSDIIRDVERQLGISISYDKAWRAREVALSSLKRTRERREKRPAGRPKKIKTVSIDKEPILRLCGICGARGHNKKTCPRNKLLLPP